jgi:hypothetical protein
VVLPGGTVEERHYVAGKVYGRKIMDNLRPGTTYHLYPWSLLFP